LVYDALFGPRRNDEVWWWKKLWKEKSPPKSILFMLLVLNNKVLTWEMLRKRKWEGPNVCLLCKNSEETIVHLFLTCTYSQQIWREVEGQLGLSNLWDRDTIVGCFYGWFSNKYFKYILELPYLVLRGIRLAQNYVLYEDKFVPSFKTFARFLTFSLIIRIVQSISNPGMWLNSGWTSQMYNSIPVDLNTYQMFL
jgi:hypothetical protein